VAHIEKLVGEKRGLVAEKRKNGLVAEKRKKLNAELWDRVHFLMRRYWDGMCRTVLYYNISNDDACKGVTHGEISGAANGAYANNCKGVTNGALDEVVLRKTMEHVLRSVPVLHSSYVNHPVKPYWRVNEINDGLLDKALSVVDVSAERVSQAEGASDTCIFEDGAFEREIENFVLSQIKASDVVQMKVRVVRYDRGLCQEVSANNETCQVKGCHFAICFLFNHMCCDGHDFLYLVRKFCDTYSKLMNGEEPPKIKNGSRHFQEMYSGFEGEELKKARKLNKNVSSVKEKYTLDFLDSHGRTMSGRMMSRRIMSGRRMSDKSKEVSFFERIKISPDVFNAIKAKSKADKVTINDVLLAAFARAIYRQARIPVNESLHISVMKDLRANIPEADTRLGITNHTGFLPCRLGECAERKSAEASTATMTATVMQVHNIMSDLKNDEFSGMYGISLLDLAYHLFPDCIAKLAIHIGYKSPRYSVSNLGLLKGQEFALNVANDIIVPCDMLASGTVKYKPAIQLSAFTLDDQLTLSMFLKGNEHDRKVIREFLQVVESELKGYIEI